MKKLTYSETQTLLEKLSHCKGNWHPNDYQVVLIGELSNYIYISSNNILCKKSLEQIMNEIRLKSILEIKENKGMYNIKYLNKDDFLREEK